MTIKTEKTREVSTMNLFVRLAVTMLPLILLVSCGGGGGTATSNLESLPELPLSNTSNARAFVGGQATPVMTHSQIFRNIQSRANSADTIQFSDIAVYTNGITQPDARTNCFSRTCSFTLDQTRFTLSLDNLETYPALAGNDFDRFNADAFVVMIDNFSHTTNLIESTE